MRFEVPVVAVVAALLLSGSQRVAPPTPVCQRPFARGEWGSDIRVDLTLSQPPSVGQTASLLVELCAKRSGLATLELTLPEGFDWVTLPPNFSAHNTVSHNPANFGCLHVADGTVYLAAREPWRLTATVKARADGRATLIATAKPATGVGDTSFYFMTAGPTLGSSFVGFHIENPSGTMAVTDPPVPVCAG